jgi:hypothetical protein
MFQLTVLRVMDRACFTAPIIVANAAHAGIVTDQLAEIGVTDATILLEPCARNTAPAIALAAHAVSAPQRRAQHGRERVAIAHVKRRESEERPIEVERSHGAPSAAQHCCSRRVPPRPRSHAARARTAPLWRRQALARTLAVPLPRSRFAAAAPRVL